MSTNSDSHTGITAAAVLQMGYVQPTDISTQKDESANRWLPRLRHWGYWAAHHQDCFVDFPDFAQMASNWLTITNAPKRYTYNEF